MAVVDAVWKLIEPDMESRGLEVVDIEHGRGLLRVYLDREGDGGIDLDAITDATEVISRLLDDADPVPGSYTLEVSSPGLERPLKTPAHFARAVGDGVSVRVKNLGRIEGVLVSATDDAIEVAPRSEDGEPRRIALADIEKARTVFEWGPPPKPGKTPKKKKAPTP